jgi:hypothetical protein
MTDVLLNADRDVCAREAAAAIEAVLDRRCPEMKVVFWSAVEKLYRLDVEPRVGLPTRNRDCPRDRPQERGRHWPVRDDRGVCGARGPATG